jgi:FHA domain
MLLPRCNVTLVRNSPVAMRISQIIAATITSVAVACAAAMMFADPAAAVVLALTLDATRAFATNAWNLSHQWALENYNRTPALMVGLTAVLLLPPLALASGLISKFAMPRSAGNRRPSRAAAAPRSAAPDHPSNMAWPREAWLTGSASTETRRPPLLRTIPRELLSIGRGEDNDLVLDAPTVHRYHAIIQRTPEALFLIKDLGGPGGNGVFVNGERVTEAHLLDADRISLGNVGLVFHARRVGENSYGMIT